MSNFLSLNQITKEYPQGETPLRVLKGISLDVAEGEYLTIVGASGAGKSTLLHIMGLLDRPTSGELLLEGRDLGRVSGLEQARLRNRLFGFVFQFFHLLPDFSAVENVMLPGLVGQGILGWTRARRQVRSSAAELLDRVGLKARMRHRPAELSGGERQRVALCRALINKPRVLLLDEPTGNLDSHTGEEIHELVRNLNKQGGQTIVMVTHNEAAARRAGRVIRMLDGEIVDSK